MTRVSRGAVLRRIEEYGGTQGEARSGVRTTTDPETGERRRSVKVHEWMNGDHEWVVGTFVVEG